MSLTIREKLSAQWTSIPPNSSSTAITSFAGMNLADLEKKAIEETLASVNGNREMAARQLGIGERTLYRKLQEWKKEP